jgi:hypothetical protein
VAKRILKPRGHQEPDRWHGWEREKEKKKKKKKKKKVKEILFVKIWRVSEGFGP